MPRPKTKSDPIQFRVPLELWDIIEAEAAKEGLSVSQLVDTKITTWLQRLAKEAAKGTE